MSAFTADEAAQIFEIVGIPRAGAGQIVTSLSHRPPSLAHTWEPTYTTGNFSSVVTLIEGAINSASPAMVTRTRVHLARWDAIGGTNPMRLTAGSAGEQGIVVDYPLERENIRQAIGNILGVWVPKGGFMADTERVYGGECLGDR